ncbi:MAG TPA: bifunctional hydroxymethylpyrimidine kinase/phosphomethylpyrimidine kinase [Edaphobacter sp.]|nr:bifunctional hydroxymethylpyrimidine kinase/phosphomethylpyrimidine kinase [Edaphobacter sp.]
MQTVLSIAGFDPSSGAGVTADLMVFAAHGLFGISAITSFTVQSTQGVRRSEPVRPETLRETLDCLHADLPAAGVKLGMLATPEIVTVVSEYVERLQELSPEAPIILDPVICSSSGRELLSLEGIALLRERLLPLASWVTPNLDELGLLSGFEVATPQDVVSASRALARLYPGLNVLATGGHLERPDDLLLAAGGEPEWLAGERIESRSTHGTGCALSSALLSRLVLGDGAREAAHGAKHYVAEAIRRAVPLGYGNGPLNHLWPLR